MKITSLFLFLVIAQSALAARQQSTATAAVRYVDEVFTAVTVSYDIAYGISMKQNGVNETQLADLYVPSGDSVNNRPVIILAQPGAFKASSKSDLNTVNLAKSFAKRGYVTLAINYRKANHSLSLFSPSLYPWIQDAQQDAMGAVRFVRANAAVYGANPNKIMLGGWSAGAATALYVNADPDNSPLENSADHTQSSAVSAVASISGWMNDLNLITYGDRPIVIVHGTSDTTVPYQKALDLDAAAQAAGVVSELHSISRMNHDISKNIATIATKVATFFYNQVVNVP